MRFAIVCAVTLLSCGTALASGGLSCTGEDAKAKFEIEAGVTRGMGSPVFSLRGSIESLDKTVAEDLRRIEALKDNLAQYWLDGEELRLLVYRERTEGDHGYVELTLRTKAGEEGTYEGTYALTIFDTKGDTSGQGRTVNAEGKVSCFVE